MSASPVSAFRRRGASATPPPGRPNAAPAPIASPEAIYEHLRGLEGRNARNIAVVGDYLAGELERVHSVYRLPNVMGAVMAALNDLYGQKNLHVVKVTS